MDSVPSGLSFDARSRAALAFALALASLVTGCGATPTLPASVRAEALGFEHHAHEHPLWSRWGAAGSLRFLEVVVGTDEVDAPLPLVLSLHGFADGPRVPSGPYLSRARPFRMLAPEAPIVVTHGRAWSSHRVLDQTHEALGADLEARLPALLALLDVVAVARPTRGRPILTGYSQGGHLALLLGTRHPERFSRVIAMAAWIPPAIAPRAAPRAPTPLRGVHAREDERVPFAPTEALYAELARLGWDARLEVVEGSHAPSPAIEGFFGRELDAALLELTP